MKVATPHRLTLYPAQLLRRYKRFLADLELPDGRGLTVHCPNTGSMKNCLQPGGNCWYSGSDNPKRKYPHTLEVVTPPDGDLAGINTARANDLVEEAIGNGVIRELQGYRQWRREVAYGEEKSRIDFLLDGGGQSCFVEVKNVTLCEGRGHGLFPDAVSERGTKHLRELMQMVRQGHRAVLLFCVQHTGIRQVAPADTIDPAYGKTLREAAAVGVEILAYQAVLAPEQGIIRLQKKLPVALHE